MNNISDNQFEVWAENSIRVTPDINDVLLSVVTSDMYSVLLDINSAIQMAEFFDRLDTLNKGKITDDTAIHILSLMLNYRLLSYTERMTETLAFSEVVQHKDYFMISDFIQSGYDFYQSEFDDFINTTFPHVDANDITELIDTEILGEGFVDAIIADIIDDYNSKLLTCDHDGYAISSRFNVIQIGSDIIRLEVQYNDLEYG